MGNLHLNSIRALKLDWINKLISRHAYSNKVIQYSNSDWKHLETKPFFLRFDQVLWIYKWSSVNTFTISTNIFSKLLHRVVYTWSETVRIAVAPVMAGTGWSDVLYYTECFHLECVVVLPNHQIPKRTNQRVICLCVACDLLLLPRSIGIRSNLAST